MIALRPQRPWEDEDCVIFRQIVRRFFADNIPGNDPQWRQQKFVDRSFWTAAGELGLLCPSVDPEFSGSGGDFRFDAIISEEVSYADCSSFIGQNIHGNIVAHYLFAYGTPEQKAKWLPAMATGAMIGAIGMTEPGAGSDLKAIRTTAIRDGDHYVINGSKTFITNGYVADCIILAVKTDAAAGAHGVSLVVVETAKADGFKRGRNLEKIGMKGSDTAELFFENMRVPVENLLGEEARGFSMMMQQLPRERLGIAIGAQAMMERALELTLDYVRERQSFGKSLIAHQNTRFVLADCVTQARLSRAFVDDCVAKMLRGELTSVEASMAKMAATDAMNRIVDACVQLHGGYGYMEEYPIARLWADGRVQRIYGGANEIMKEIIARDLEK